MNTKYDFLFYMACIIIIGSGIMLLFTSCDNRDPNITLSLSTNVQHVYNGDNTIITITAKYTSDNLFNQRLYFKTDNGYIKVNNSDTWAQQDSIIYINTNISGECLLQFKHPNTNGYTNIYCWTYVYDDLILVEEINTKLQIPVLQR